MDAPDPFADWPDKLSLVEGVLIGNQQRVAVADLLDRLGAAHLTGNDRQQALCRLKATMTPLGWTAAVTRVGGSKTVRGYVRPFTPEPVEGETATAEPEQAAVPEKQGKDVIRPGSPEELARRLEAVCKLSLEKLEAVLNMPIIKEDGGVDGNVLRAITASAGTVLNAQLRADETRLRAKSNGDALARLLRIIRQEKRLIKAVAKTADEQPTNDNGLPLAPDQGVVIDNEEEPVP
jgi:hypothetical protein